MADDASRARAELERLLDAHGLGVPAGFFDAAEAYVRLLLAANARLNLTRVVEPDAVARLHLLDSLAALPLLDELAPDRALDLGTGGGVPGLVLALARPSVRWTLVDSVAKKADAVRSFVGALGLTNVDTVAQRVEVVGRDPAFRERFDIVAARACAELPVLAEYALPLLRIGGRLIAWKGPMGDDEMEAGADAAAILGGAEPEVRPSGHAVLGDHRFVLVRKARPTPDRYPRRAGQPSRRPLPDGKRAPSGQAPAR